MSKREFKTFRDIPDWRVYPRNVLSTLRVGGELTVTTIYDIFKKWDKKDEEAYKDVAFKEQDKYWPVGTLNEKGILKASCLGNKEPFFGSNVKQAVRYLFLKTQQPFWPSEDAQKNVLAKYPNAVCKRDGSNFGAMFWVSAGNQDLGAGFSEDGAWCSAGCSLIK